MKGYVYITSSGYDPDKGKSVKDPYLGKNPTLGACMPNIRQHVVPGDDIFVVSGKVLGIQQYVIGGFEVAAKIDAITAYEMFPEHRLRQGDDGELVGNIIVDARGKHHPLDTHKAKAFERRIENYIIGRNPVVLSAPHEIARGRIESLDVLQGILGKRGPAPIRVIGRASRLDRTQVRELHDWLLAVKSGL